ncbi:hypothetical protein [Actinomadura kijaniata]|uniref:hypothetical protein n=1 Tax=Actinomadura kijaniata TaxID=46161 RepID=UPI00082ED91A|nr:hypothetical protein [Actinomadura kijaniata]
MHRRPASAAALAALTAAVVAAPTAVAATTGDTAHRKAEVTDVREVLNRRSTQVQLYKGEDQVSVTVPANGRWAGSMWIPWVGNNAEMGKSITVSWGGTTRYWVFQDYWNTQNQVRYSTTNSYQSSLPVPGSSTGGGRKSLIVQSDGSLYLQAAA